MLPKASYSRKHILSLRAAMAFALTDKLRNTGFSTPGGGLTYLNEVYPEWPDPEDNFVTPAATIMPGTAVYEDAGMTPTLLQETWEPYGQPGWGLYKTSELVVPYTIQIRCPTSAERDVIVAGVEDMWVDDEVLMDHQEGARYGILIDLPQYWGVTATFTLMSMETLDNEDAAMRNHREATFSIMGRAPAVKLGPVQPCKLTIKVDV